MFYPSRRPRGFDELAYYAEHFDTVEVNSTFYRMPEAACRLRLAPPHAGVFSVLGQAVPEVHAPGYVSGAAGRRPSGTSSAADLDLFRLGIAPLAEAGRLAAVLVQFPPSFHAEPTRATISTGWRMRFATIRWRSSCVTDPGATARRKRGD